MKKLLLLSTATIFYFIPVFSQTLYTNTVQEASRFNPGLGALGTPIIVFDDVLIPSAQVQGTDSVRVTKAKFGIRRLPGAPAVTVRFYLSTVDDTATIANNQFSIPPVLIGSVNLPANVGTTTLIVPLGDSVNTLFAVKTNPNTLVPGYQAFFVGLSFSDSSYLNGWRYIDPLQLQSNNLDTVWRYNADSSTTRYASAFSGATYYMQLFATASSPLPVSLTSFTAQRNKNVNVLSWNTQQELNTSYFVVERSTNGEDYVSIGQVAASGNSSTILNYTFTDMHPSKGNNYYRLRTFDKDNSSKISYIRRVRNEGLASVSLYPNPVKDRLSVSIDADVSSDGHLSITDVSGKTVYTRSLKIQKGNTILPINLKSISRGSYILKLHLNDDLIVQKFNKQ